MAGRSRPGRNQLASLTRAWLCYARKVPPLLLIASVLLAFGLLAAAAFATGIKIACFPRRANAFEALVPGGAFGALIATATFVVLGEAGVDLDGRLFGDALQNGAAWVVMGALAGTIVVGLRARDATALRRP